MTKILFANGNSTDYLSSSGVVQTHHGVEVWTYQNDGRWDTVTLYPWHMISGVYKINDYRESEETLGATAEGRRSSSSRGVPA